jgi:AdoMet-dependent rRNA methyltransferase SPB1
LREAATKYLLCCAVTSFRTFVIVMAIQKKLAKGRLDKWYRLAKEKGYRARAAFKLIQLNKRYGFLEKSRVLLDLCAAPGSWCQVASEAMPVNSIIVGVDLAPIKPIPRVITFQGDITTDKCRATIRSHLKTWKADTVLHDGAPNVGTSWVQDSFNQAELTLQAMKLAADFLVEGGTFVTKVFRSKEYNKLLWVFNQLFGKVEATKPPSSRNVSAEIFVVCRGFKAPKKVDPRFFDPRAVFAELTDPAPNNEAKVYNPETKKRKRDGYEEGDYTQHKEMPASEFIQSTDPIAILGQYHRLSFAQQTNGDVALAALGKLPETTAEIRQCCEDLRVLGRKDFKLLLKWRLKVREIFGFPSKKAEPPVVAEEVAEVESMDEELKLQKELQELKDRDSSQKKRDRRRDNERKQKEIIRMQLNMTAPMDIGLEQAGPTGEGSVFALKTMDTTDALARISKGRMAIVTDGDGRKDRDSGIGSSGETDDESDEEEDRLERELDALYEDYKDRASQADAKARAKKARDELGDDEWEGVSASEKGDSDSDDDSMFEEASETEEVGDSVVGSQPLLTDLDGDDASAPGGLSKRARAFFNQDIFQGISGILDSGNGHMQTDAVNEVEEQSHALKGDGGKVQLKERTTQKASKVVTEDFDWSAGEEDDEAGFQVVKPARDEDWEEKDKRRADGRLDIDVITAEAMTLAHALATGEKSRHDVVDDGFNKHAFRDRDGLPEWFLDDEGRHDKLHRPVTKAAATAIREKLRALNARPIKKVREAKARKKFKAAQKLEKLKKKSETLVNDENLTEKDKATAISKMMSNAAKKKPRVPIKVVVAKGVNKGIRGRPQGVGKGRYKVVDPRMKKDMRAMKRVAQKIKKR